MTILVALPFLFTSCEQGIIGISGEGEIVQATLDVDDFDGFANNIAADIYVSQGDQYEVVMEAQENIIDNLNIDDIDQVTMLIQRGPLKLQFDNIMVRMLLVLSPPVATD